MSSITDLSRLSKPSRALIFSYHGVNNLNDFFDFLKKTFGLKSWKQISDWLYNKKFPHYDKILILEAYSKRQQQNNNDTGSTVSTTGGGSTTVATSTPTTTNNKADPKANLDCHRKRKISDLEANLDDSDDDDDDKDTGTVSTTTAAGTTTNDNGDKKENLARQQEEDSDTVITTTSTTTTTTAAATKNADPKANLDDGKKMPPRTYDIWSLSWTGRKSICIDSGAKDLDDYLNEFKSKKQLLDCILGNSEFSGNDIIIIMGKYFERHDADNDSDDDNDDDDNDLSDKADPNLDRNLDRKRKLAAYLAQHADDSDDDDLSDNESDDDSSKMIKILSTDWCRVFLITVLAVANTVVNAVLVGLMILAPTTTVTATTTTTTTTTKNDDDGFDDHNDIPTSMIPIVSDDKAKEDFLKLAVKNVDDFYKVFGVEVSIGPTGNDDQEVFEVVNLPGVEKENIDEFLAPFSNLSVEDILEIKSQLFASSADTTPPPATTITTTTKDDDDKKTKLQKELAIQQSILEDNKHKLAAWNYLFEVQIRNQNKKVEELKEELSTL